MINTKKLFKYVVIAACCSVFSLSANAKQYKFGHYFPATDYRGETAQKFADELAERSKDFDVNIFPSESLVKGRDALQATARGTVDFYSLAVSYMTGSMPLTKIFTMPFPRKSYTDQAMLEFANNPEVVEILDEQFKKTKVKLLGFINSSGHTTGFLAKQLNSLGDLSGKRMRGVGGYSDEALQELGVSISFMSAAEQFVQLETGGLDGVVTTDASYVSQDLARVAPAELTDGVVRVPYALIMSRRAWDKLSDENKAHVDEAVAATIAWSNEMFPKEAERLAEEVAKVVKHPYTLTEEERQTVDQISDQMLAKFAAETGKQGERLVELYKQIE